MILLTLTIYSSEHDLLMTVYANTWHTDNGHVSLLYEIFGLTINTKAIISKEFYSTAKIESLGLFVCERKEWAVSGME